MLMVPKDGRECILKRMMPLRFLRFKERQKQGTKEQIIMKNRIMSLEDDDEGKRKTGII
jgi:hypothetical protein